MRVERQKLVEELVSSLRNAASSSASMPPNQDSVRSRSAATHRAMKVAAQPARDPPLSIEETMARFSDLALKNRIALHGDIADATDRVLEQLLRVVSDQSQQYRAAREAYLNLLSEERTRNPETNSGHVQWPGPTPPPIQYKDLSEVLQFLLLLSSQPKLYTRTHAALLLSGKGPHAEDFFSPAEREAQDKRIAAEILADDPTSQEEHDKEDTWSIRDDWQQDSDLDTDKWDSDTDTISDVDQLSSARSAKRKQPSEHVQNTAASLLESENHFTQLVDSWSTSTGTKDWKTQHTAELDTFAEFQNMVRKEEAIAPSLGRSRLWDATMDSHNPAGGNTTCLGHLSAIRDMIDALTVVGAGAKIVHRQIQHTTHLASEMSWTRVERIRESVHKLDRYAQGLTAPIVSLGYHETPAPPLPAQALGDGLLLVLQRWDLWLAERDGFIVSCLSEELESPIGGDERILRSLSLTEFLSQVESRAQGLVNLASLLALEEEDSVVLAEGKMERIDHVSVFNRLHALLGMHRASMAGQSAGSLSNPATQIAVEQDLASCYAAVALPYLKEVMYWLHLGAPFHPASAQVKLVLNLFRPDYSLVASDETFWTRGWRYASVLDQIKGHGDTSAQHSQMNVLSDISEVDHTVASAPLVYDQEPHVPLFLVPSAEAVLQAGLSVGLLRTFQQDDDARSEAAWRNMCTSAARSLGRAACNTSKGTHIVDEAVNQSHSSWSCQPTLARHQSVPSSPHRPPQELSILDTFPPASPGSSSVAGLREDSEPEDECEDVLAVVESIMSSSLGLARLAQKRARDAFILPAPDGCNLPFHLSALNGLMLMGQAGDLQVWVEEVFASLGESDVHYSSVNGMSGALDPASLLAVLREAIATSPNPAWLDLTAVTFRLLPLPPPTNPSATIVMDPWTTARGRYSLAQVGRIVPSYRVPWPLTYVVTQHEMVTYAQSFSQLLTLRWTKKLLDYAIMRPGVANRKEFPNKREPRQFHALRQKLLWLLNTLMAHFSSIVVDHFGTQLEEALDNATSVAELVNSHRTCVQELHAQLLLLPLDPDTAPSAGLRWSARSIKDTSQMSFSVFGQRPAGGHKNAAEAVRALQSLAVQLVYAHDKYQSANISPARPQKRGLHHRSFPSTGRGHESDGSDAEEGAEPDNVSDNEVDPVLWAEQVSWIQPTEGQGHDYETQLALLDTAVQTAHNDLITSLDRSMASRARMATAALDPTNPGAGKGKLRSAAAAAEARAARETMHALASTLRPE